mgnify:CR=1 FL=1
MRKEEIILGIFLIIIIPFLSANHIFTATSTSFNEDIIATYNFSIQNNDTGKDANITQVKITIPSNLSFISGTQGTNANPGSFSNTSTVLTWVNSTNYLINGSETKFFWFNGNTTTPGNYTLTIETTNSSGTSSSIINFTINLVVPTCTENWTYTNYTECINGTQTRNATDSNNCNTTNNRNALSKTCTIQNPNITINTICIQNWSCTNYSACVNGLQVRVCSDLKTCGNLTDKPAVNKTCVVECVADWDCTDWAPAECPKSGKQTQNCTDLNVCEDDKIGTQNCTYEGSNTWIWITVISTIIVLIIIGAIIITRYSKKKTDTLNETFGFPGAPQFPRGPPRGPPPSGMPSQMMRPPMQRRLPTMVPRLPNQPPY